MNIKIDALKDSSEFLNIIINNVDEAIFLVDKNIRIYDINKAGLILFNKNSNHIINELFGNALECTNVIDYNKDCGDTPECLNCKLRTSINIAFKEKSIHSKERFEKDFNIDNIRLNKIFKYSARYVEYNNNELVLIIMEDITDMEMQKLKLEKLNEEKNHLLGIAAHDLRSPISIIQMYSEFMLDKLNSNLTKEQLKFIKQIYDTSFSMTNLLKDILDMTRIDLGEININKQKDDYIDFIKNNIKLNKIIAKKKNIKIELKTNEKQLIFNFDKNKLTQVLNNLTSNAIKFSNTDTKIKINVSIEKNKVLTKITDQGQGIPKEETNKIFKPFQKTSVKPTAGESSTGLGLTIVKKIIESHGGKIEFTTEAGKGSCFYFYLPLD